MVQWNASTILESLIMTDWDVDEVTFVAGCLVVKMGTDHSVAMWAFKLLVFARSQTMTLSSLSRS